MCLRTLATVHRFALLNSLKPYVVFIVMSFPGSHLNRQSNSPVRMLASKPKERDMYDSSPNYSPLPGKS